MAISEFEKKKCERDLKGFLAKRRPPTPMRPQVDVDYRIVDQSVEIFTIRPDWADPSRRMEEPIAKATYIKTGSYWKVFWMRGDMKWHSYEPRPRVKLLQDFLIAVDEDEFCCLWG